MWGCCLRSPTVEITPIASQSPARSIVIPVLGVTQIFAWGSTYYLLAVLAKPIADDTGWPLTWVVGGLSLGLLTEGFVSPRVGDSIQHRGGRPVLAVSAILFAFGLIGVAVARSVPTYVASWLVLGAGMGAGLYDAAFATLGRLYGQQARTSIAMLTLFGGLASTIVGDTRLPIRMAGRLPCLCRSSFVHRAAALRFRSSARTETDSHDCRNR
jgi:MFS family permease